MKYQLSTFTLVLTVLGLASACGFLASPPVAPSYVTISKSGVSTIEIQWHNNSPDAQAFLVQRSSAQDSGFETVADLPPTEKSWSETLATDGVRYYRVTVKTPSGQASSEVVSVNITGIDPNSVESNWDNTGWDLVWSDEFNGSTLDTSNWVIETGNGSGGWGNNELQYYRGENISFTTNNSRKVMVITAKKENISSQNYTSARIISKGKRSFTYGRIEAAMRLPYGQGIWPAFWMLGNSLDTVGWPASGEIDIMEMVGGSLGDKSDSKTYGTIHYANAGGTREYIGGNKTLPSPQKFHQDFHLFGVEWNQNSITWYLDGVAFHTESITQADRSEFRSPFFLLFNLAVGGNWPGSPDATTVFPQEFMIDWVRVYQQ